jgi:hypothetical protein
MMRCCSQPALQPLHPAIDIRYVALSAVDLANADRYVVDVVPYIREIRTTHEFWARHSVLDVPYERMFADPKDALTQLAACVEVPITDVEAQRLCDAIASLSDGDVPPGTTDH